MGEAVAAAAAEFHAEEFPVPVGMPEGTTCNELPSWLQDAINDVVQGVIAEIPNHKTLSHLPVEAKVRVGMVDAEVRNLTVRSLQMSRITMAECRSPREGLASFVPKLLPDVVLVHAKDVNLTQGLQFQTPGFLGGLGSIGASAVSNLTGHLNLTIVNGKNGNATHVTGCDATFAMGDTSVAGPAGLNLDVAAVPLPLPIGAILCYGPAALLGPASGLVGVELQGAGVLAGKTLDEEFSGLVDMLNKFFKKYSWYAGKYAGEAADAIAGGQATRSAEKTGEKVEEEAEEAAEEAEEEAEEAVETWYPGKYLSEGLEDMHEEMHRLSGKPSSPPSPPPGNCWDACGSKGGACDEFCGEGYACCQGGFDDPHPCPKSLPTDRDYHFCVPAAADDGHWFPGKHLMQGMEEVKEALTSSPLPPAQPPSPPPPPPPLPANCWSACGGKGGACDDFCGEGQACCQSGFGDPWPCPESMPDSLAALDFHFCVAAAPPMPPSPPASPSGGWILG